LGKERASPVVAVAVAVGGRVVVVPPGVAAAGLGGGDGPDVGVAASAGVAVVAGNGAAEGVIGDADHGVAAVVGYTHGAAAIGGATASGSGNQVGSVPIDGRDMPRVASSDTPNLAELFGGSGSGRR